MRRSSSARSTYCNAVGRHEAISPRGLPKPHRDLVLGVHDDFNCNRRRPGWRRRQGARRRIDRRRFSGDRHAVSLPAPTCPLDDRRPGNHKDSHDSNDRQDRTRPASDPWTDSAHATFLTQQIEFAESTCSAVSGHSGYRSTQDRGQYRVASPGPVPSSFIAAPGVLADEARTSSAPVGTIVACPRPPSPQTCSPGIGRFRSTRYPVERERYRRLEEEGQRPRDDGRRLLRFPVRTGDHVRRRPGRAVRRPQRRRAGAGLRARRRGAMRPAPPSSSRFSPWASARSWSWATAAAAA